MSAFIIKYDEVFGNSDKTKTANSEDITGKAAQSPYPTE